MFASIGFRHPSRHEEADRAGTSARPASFRRGFLLRFIALAAAIIVGLAGLAASRWAAQITAFADDGARILEARRSVIEQTLRDMAADALVLSHGGALPLADDRPEHERRRVLERQFAALAAARRHYRQVAYVDDRGVEVIRVEPRDDGAAKPAADADLRDVSQQPWFRQAATLANEEILASPAARAGGSAADDAARTAVMWLVAPVFDIGGRRQGSIVLGTIAEMLFARPAAAAAGTGGPALYDRQGNRLAGGQAEQTSATDGASTVDFATARPAAWAQILAGRTGHFIDADAAYAFTTVAYRTRRTMDGGAPFLEAADAPAQPGTEEWKLVYVEPRTFLVEPASLSWLALAAAGLIVLAVLSAVATRGAIRRTGAAAALVASRSELRDQLAFTRTLLESLPTPVFLKGPDGRYLACNGAFESLVGHSRGDIVGRDAGDTLPAGMAALLGEQDQAILARGERSVYEAADRRDDGTLRHFIVFKSPFADAGRAIAGLIGVVLDISELKNAEAALRRSHEFYDRLLNTIPQPIFVKDRTHRFIFLNDAACAAFGFAREEMLDRSDHDFFPKQQAEVFIARDDVVFATGRPHLHEEVFTDRGGREHVILTKKAVFEDGSGASVLVGVITDITERKRTEAMLQLSAEVFEHSAEGIMITDAHGTVLSVNRAFCAITGYCREEAIGRNPRFLASGQHDRAFFDGIFDTVGADGHWTGEIVNRRPSGEIYVVEETICAVRDADGRIQRFIGIIGDITERKNKEERIRYLAQHDILTGLANRALLHDRIESAMLRARRDRRKVAVLMLDLDRFKEINDRFGHADGDLLLKQVAARLVGCVRQTDTVSRIGGDEFVVVLPGLRGRTDAERVAGKIIDELSRPFELEGGSATVGASLGVAVYPDDGLDEGALCRTADEAMYRMKQSHRHPESAASLVG